jgi:hypothetical protein
VVLPTAHEPVEDATYDQEAPLAPVVVLSTAAQAPAADEWEQPVRPRRVELPEVRRTERPTAEEYDPLASMRAGWKSHRDAEDDLEPAPVLRLPDPVRPARPNWSAPVSEDETPPLVLDRAWAAPGEEPALDPAAENPSWASQASAAVSDETNETDELQAVLAAMAESESEPVPEAVEAPVEDLPRAVRIWRDIVARTPEIPSNNPILAMIDQLLCELSRDDGLSEGTDAQAATISGQTRAA